jgi:hypothetical protein
MVRACKLVQGMVPPRSSCWCRCPLWTALAGHAHYISPKRRACVMFVWLVATPSNLGSPWHFHCCDIRGMLGIMAVVFEDHIISEGSISHALVDSRKVFKEQLQWIMRIMRVGQSVFCRSILSEWEQRHWHTSFLVVSFSKVKTLSPTFGGCT